MMDGIYQELTFLMKAFFLGILISFIYDQIRVVRRCILHNYFLIAVEDIIFWTWVTIKIFSLQLEENNGTFRLFSVVATAVGMLPYRIIMGNHYVRYMSIVLEHVIKLIYGLMTYILTPYFYFQNQTKIAVKKMRKKLRHRKRIRKIRLTSMLKMLRITLCKRRNEGRDRSGRTQNSG